MNLIIPLLKGQLAQITIQDTKTKETFTYHANHTRAVAIKQTGNLGVVIFDCTPTIENTNLYMKNVTRAKRMCSKSIIIK